MVEAAVLSGSIITSTIAGLPDFKAFCNASSNLFGVSTLTPNPPHGSANCEKFGLGNSTPNIGYPSVLIKSPYVRIQELIIIESDTLRNKCRVYNFKIHSLNSNFNSF